MCSGSLDNGGMAVADARVGVYIACGLSFLLRSVTAGSTREEAARAARH
jgi:hypothetical protein